MTEPSARWLSRERVEALIGGLRGRIDQGVLQLSGQLAGLRQQLQAVEQTADSELQEIRTRHHAQRESLITGWDEQRHSVWDDAELKAFHALQTAQARERELRVEAKRSSEQITAEAKERVTKAERRFLATKDASIQRLNQVRGQVEAVLKEKQVIEQEIATFLLQHSFTPPPTSSVAASATGASATGASASGESAGGTLEGVSSPPAGTTAGEALPTTAPEAVRASREALTRSRQWVQEMAQNRFSRTVESFWFWAVCLAVGALIAVALGGLQIVSWIVAGLVGLVVAVVAGLAGLLAVHPLIKRHIRTEYPRLRQTLNRADETLQLAAQLAIAENDAELIRLAEKRDGRIRSAAEWRETSLQELQQRIRTEIQSARARAASEIAALKQQLTAQLQEVERRGQQQLQASDQAHQSLLATRAQDLTERQEALLSRIERTHLDGDRRIKHAVQKAASWFARARRWSTEKFADWSALTGDAAWPVQDKQLLLPLGTVAVSDHLPADIERLAGQPLVADVYFEPFRDRFLTITADPGAVATQQLIRSLLLRGLTMLPPGKTQACIIDPPGLGRDFGWLMHLGDFNPDLVWHRVWTQPVHIAKQLQQLSQHAEEFIQQSLRNQYQTIQDYNRDAGPLAEPYRFLVWNAFPAGLDDHAWKALHSLLGSGTRCGIVPILVIDPAQGWEQDSRSELLQRGGLHLTLDADGVAYVQRTMLGSMPLQVPAPPADAMTHEIIQQVGKRALLASRIEVPLGRIAPPRDQWWQADSSALLDIPIGQSGVGRTQSLKLGAGTAQHAIVAGKTGSGKSTLLHALITSAGVKYSPERLRLVLLDFKKGVEFQAYSQAELPHADIIGIESHREFGLSALEYVDQCMQLRGQMFRDAGVQDLPSWNLLHADRQLPRMLIVIDEFQELFVEDDKLTAQVSMILDRIVRQGRSFGIHAVLSSQTLAGAYSLPRTTMGQMGVRIALQCDAGDAQIIFADDNPAAARLKNPGQAVYNDAGGRIEGNQPMQIGWLTKTEQLEWLAELPRGYRNHDSSTNLLGRAVVYDGNRLATWDPAVVQRAAESARQRSNATACWCALGESVAIEPAVCFPLTDQAGRNILLVGGDQQQAASVMLSIAATFHSEHPNATPAQFFIGQGAKPTDAQCLHLASRLKQFSSHVIEADVRGVDQLLSQLHAMLQERLAAPDDRSQWAPVLLILVNIGRLRSLRPEDEFGLGSFGESKLTPDKLLEELLRDGPSHQIHTLVYGENAGTLARWLTRAALREFEVRLLMQLGPNDSTQLIDSTAAAQLGTHVMLLSDEATSTLARFRPFDYDSLTEFSGPRAATRQK
jgi:DNA segregation ATPase FtsK/SpoIIIE, S-DNA-T family